MTTVLWLGAGAAILLAGIVIYDILQKKHAILRIFPVIGHLRYILESFGPELRQYIVTGNDEERPFSRDQRRWVYASSKRENNAFGFGTDNDLELTANTLILKHAAFPLPDYPHTDPWYPVPAAKILGGWRRRRGAFRPESIVNISGMSFGSLSANAVEALNRGAQLARCLHNTGEGGIAECHRAGGDLIWQIGTGYFGCRDAQGCFDLAQAIDRIASAPVRALEIKLSQGAKPGRGGLLPGGKVTADIARVRGVPIGKDVDSPPFHTAFAGADSLLDFVEMLADETGLPVGIKAAVGEVRFWRELADLMDTTGRGVDFITIDGGEGGTGAAPLVFADTVALPFKIAMSRVYRIFVDRGLHEKVVFIGSGKLGFPETALFAFGLGCDMVNVGRETMLAIGCIQAQRCHTNKCPTGVTTQSWWRQRGLDPAHKSVRAANYIATLRKEIMWLCHASGHAHPAFVTLEDFEIIDGRYGAASAAARFHMDGVYAAPSEADRAAIADIMAAHTGVHADAPRVPDVSSIAS